jgi:hypothetical protein
MASLADALVVPSVNCGGVAVGRKNWLFAGSMKGLHRAALLYSLVQSAKLAGVEPWAYLKDVLERR